MSSGITQGPWVGGSGSGGGGGGSGTASQIFVDGPYLYFGSEYLDGSWRQSISGNDLIFERRESGVWVQKYAITP